MEGEHRTRDDRCTILDVYCALFYNPLFFGLLQLPWPRTGSERLLVEMMEGSAAQMLCIVETLSDSNRRTLLTQPPAADNEVEILDVYSELFMAAQEIIAGIL